jgi:hypothetical protein
MSIVKKLTIVNGLTHILNVGISTTLLITPSLGANSIEYIWKKSIEVVTCFFHDPILAKHHSSLEVNYTLPLITQSAIEKFLLPQLNISPYSKEAYLSGAIKNLPSRSSSPTPPSYPLLFLKEVSSHQETAICPIIENITFTLMPSFFLAQTAYQYEYEKKPSKEVLHKIKTKAFDLSVREEKGVFQNKSEYICKEGENCKIFPWEYKNPLEIRAINLSTLYSGVNENAVHDFNLEKENFLIQLKEMRYIQYLNVSRMEFSKKEWSQFLEALQTLPHLHTVCIHSVTVDARQLKTLPEIQGITFQNSCPPTPYTEIALRPMFEES